MQGLGRLWSFEETFWKQRSRVSWLREGDQNTGYFHAATLQRKSFNRISLLDRGDDTWAESDEDIQTEFLAFFTQLFQTSDALVWGDVFQYTTPCIGEDQNSALERPFSGDEIVLAAKQLGALKAPGPDDFPGFFYSNYWDIVTRSINNIATTFHSNEFSIESINTTYIALTPKTANPTLVGQFRPISLCNNSFKILSKCLANRLKSIIPGIITEEQSAFFHGRQIQDNLVIAHEVFHRLKAKDSLAEFGFKIDMNKAYDKVEWSFLHETLIRMGLSPGWIRMVMQCVTTVSFSVLINGKPSPIFTPTRGLRQGDPLSPYLFILVCDVLSRNIKGAVMENRLLSLHLSRTCPGISHLFFADDSLFFSIADTENALCLMDIITSYCTASRQSLNLEISSICFSKSTSDDTATTIAALFGIQVSQSPGTYVGISSTWGKTRTQALAYVQYRISNKIDGWKGNFLSQAGREVLIKAVATAVPTYPMHLFLFPKSICKGISFDIANFWWGNSDDKNKTHWLSWEKLCRNKDEGGMNFRDFYSFNLSLLVKQCWRILRNPEALWVRILKAKYFSSCHLFQAKAGTASSWIWSSLLKGRDTIEKHARWQVVSGKDINFWGSRWVPTTPNGVIAVIDSRNRNRFTTLMVNDVIDATTGEWNIDHLKSFLTEEDFQSISAMPVGNLDAADRLIWPHNDRGEYTAKSGYHLTKPTPDLIDHSYYSVSHNCDNYVWRKIWSLDVAPKIKVFLWKAVAGALPVFWNLFTRHISSFAGCFLCGEERETIEHCLLHCPANARKIWFCSRWGYCSTNDPNSTMDSWFMKMDAFPDSVSVDHSEFMSSIAYTLFEIWKARCSFVYQGSTLSPFGPCIAARISAQVFSDALNVADGVGIVPAPKSSCNCWKKPDLGFYKLNTDAGWDSITHKASLGIIIRDDKGSVIASKAFPRDSNSVAEAEAFSLVLGVKTAASLDLLNLQVECDNQSLILAITSTITNWKLSPFVDHLLALSSSFFNVSWKWISRQANRSADAAAMLCKRGSHSLEWTTNPPTPLFFVLRNDGLPCPHASI